jgi:hypothetical protein
MLIFLLSSFIVSNQISRILFGKRRAVILRILFQSHYPFSQIRHAKISISSRSTPTFMFIPRELIGVSDKKLSVQNVSLYMFNGKFDQTRFL